jgi:hypothetical protein
MSTVIGLDWLEEPYVICSTVQDSSVKGIAERKATRVGLIISPIRLAVRAC